MATAAAPFNCQKGILLKGGGERERTFHILKSWLPRYILSLVAELVLVHQWFLCSPDMDKFVPTGYHNASCSFCPYFFFFFCFSNFYPVFLKRYIWGAYFTTVFMPCIFRWIDTIVAQERFFKKTKAHGPSMKSDFQRTAKTSCPFWNTLTAADLGLC